MVLYLLRSFDLPTGEGAAGDVSPSLMLATSPIPRNLRLLKFEKCLACVRTSKQNRRGYFIVSSEDTVGHLIEATIKFPS